MKIQINNKQNVFFCSDSHYGHSGIVAGTSEWDDKSGCRPFQTIDSHDNTLVNNINQTVGENDILFCLGDWSFGSYKTGENVSNIRNFREQINCKNIHLIFGNHDQEIVNNKDNSTIPLFTQSLEQYAGRGLDVIWTLSWKFKGCFR
ncbi:MAG TPA: metallophosphoesterase [Nitrososphaeraceae archaeon]|nr:metallophosphoesterase [Nitrososphaeraceae archaeon]